MSGLRSASIVLLVTAAFCGAAASAQAADAPVRLRVAVAVCDAQNAPAETLASAEQVVSDVYRAIGVAIEWSGAGCAADEHSLTLNMIARDASGLSVTNETLGFAAPGASVATILYDRIVVFARRFHVKRDVLLGYAMAHELGHLLLPPNSHSTEGVMRSVINMEEASAKRLRFTKAQGRLIVQRIESTSLALATH